MIWMILCEELSFGLTAFFFIYVVIHIISMLNSHANIYLYILQNVSSMQSFCRFGLCNYDVWRLVKEWVKWEAVKTDLKQYQINYTVKHHICLFRFQMYYAATCFFLRRIIWCKMQKSHQSHKYKPLTTNAVIHIHVQLRLNLL